MFAEGKKTPKKHFFARPGFTNSLGNLSYKIPARSVKNVFALDIMRNPLWILALNACRQQYGWGGIRTPDAFRHTRFPGVHNQPLCHPSKARARNRAPARARAQSITITKTSTTKS